MCTNKKGKRCSGCHSIGYCSKTCQKNDWALHKLVCQSFATLSERPSEGHNLAMQFLVDKDKPELVWIPSDSSGEIKKVLQIDYIGILGPVQINAIRKYVLDKYMFTLFHDDFFMAKRLPMNRSLVVAARAAGVYVFYPLSGPFLLIKHDKEENQLDCTAHCLRQAIDYLQGYHVEVYKGARIDVHDPRKAPPRHRKGASICAVQISCHGEIKLERSPAFTAVHVPLNHPLYWKKDEGDVSPISTKLGLGLRLWKDRIHEYTHPPAGWKDHMTASCNPAATLMMMDVEVGSDSWG